MRERLSNFVGLKDMIFQLDDTLTFPDPRYGEENGLLAMGGDLSVDRLLLAYSYGIFPWYSFRHSRQIEWWCPMNRFVIFPGEIHISHSMKQLIRKGVYSVGMNEAFDEVIDHCSKLRYNLKGAWLGDAMVEAFKRLHRQGFAASVEVWDENKQLVGGLYGVALGRAFFGESMFSLKPNASKLALIHLARFFHKYGGVLIDCQFETPHLKSMGGRCISYDEYMRLINPGNILQAE